jgi:hypothetical protein
MDLAVAAYWSPGLVRRRRVIDPTVSQMSATRRALGCLTAKGVVVAVGRRRRRKVYQLRRDAELLASLTLGTLDG